MSSPAERVCNFVGSRGHDGLMSRRGGRCRAWVQRSVRLSTAWSRQLESWGSDRQLLVGHASWAKRPKRGQQAKSTLCESKCQVRRQNSRRRARTWWLQKNMACHACSQTGERPWAASRMHQVAGDHRLGCRERLLGHWRWVEALCF